MVCTELKFEVVHASVTKLSSRFKLEDNFFKVIALH